MLEIFLILVIMILIVIIEILLYLMKKDRKLYGQLLKLHDTRIIDAEEMFPIG